MAVPESPSDSDEDLAEYQSHDVSPAKPKRQLPGWLDHFNAHDLKIIFRCWVATWAATLLIFIHPVLNELGQATFMAALVTYIAPPANILFVYLLAAFSLLLGMCLAWVWGLLTMKAAFAVRSAAEFQTRIQALQQQAASTAQQSGETVAWEAEKLVHDGFLLDTRVTVIFYVMCCIFIYALARLRCANPKLVLMQVFGMIVIDIFLLYGPTLPAFNGSVASILVKPAAIGVGIGIVCCILFFPMSTSHVVLDQLEKLIRLTGSSLETTRNRLADLPVQLAQLKASRRGMIATYKAMQPSLAFLPLDFSRGRWNAQDVQGLQERVRNTMFASLSLMDFQIARISAAQKDEDRPPTGNIEIGAAIEKEGYEIGQRHKLETAKVMDALQAPEHAAIRARTRQALRDTTKEVIQAGSQGISLAAECVSTVNASRWIGKPPEHRFEELARNMQEMLTKLRSAQEAAIVNTTTAILDSHADLFDQNGQLKLDATPGRPFLPSIIVSMVLEERILGVVHATESLLVYTQDLFQKRQKTRIWFPSRLQYAITWLLHGKLTVSVSDESPDIINDPNLAADPVAALRDRTEEGRRRLKISRGYHGSSAKRSFATRLVINTYNWLTSAGGMFAFRMVVVTIATSIPAAIPSSAGFFYREKGIWLVISAQTVLLVYMADLTFSMFSRTLGTVIGGVLGMLAWYMGSGSGPGNPYGMAASTAVMSLILLWWRVFLPPAFAMATIMAGATFCLIVGFSYDATHVKQYGLPGQGYVAVWKRVVTVLLGFVAAFIVQLLPSPPSATDHVSKTLANTIRTLSDHYALLISHWGRASPTSPLAAVAEDISIEVAEVLMSLDGPIALLKGELSFSSLDQKVLRETQEQCQYMNQALGGLLRLAPFLPKDFQQRLIGMVGILNDRAIGDIMATLAIIEQALRTGSSLPERLPAPLVRRTFDAYSEHDSGPILSTELIRDENYRRYCVAVSLYLKYLTAIDDLVLVLKRGLGERHIIYQWEEV